MATALRRYSYRFTMLQLSVLADLYATALERLEPEAVPFGPPSACATPIPRKRTRMPPPRAPSASAYRWTFSRASASPAI